MLNKKLLAKILSERGMTKEELAQRMGMTEEMFERKISDGSLGLQEAEIVIRELNVADPELLFFPEYVTSKVT